MKTTDQCQTKSAQPRKPGKARGPVQRDAKVVMAELVARLSETERAELARLRREISELKMDRAFLKKASLFFAQEASDTNEKRSH